MKTITKAPVLAILALSFVGQLQAAPAATTGSRPNCFILSAGIDNYPSNNKLNGCLNDARNTVAAFRSQKGSMFTNVHTHTLLDGQATSDKIVREWNALTKLGKPGDTIVLFLSGHGSNKQGVWTFAAYDGGVSDEDILGPADEMAAAGKKVVIIIDACFCGQLQINAKPMLDNYRDPRGGGIVLLLSSTASQTSAALGEYSAFAKAFADSIEGKADANHDGRITLTELKSYSFRRTHDLTRKGEGKSNQDAVIAWSPSYSGGAIFAVTPASTLWSGRESLDSYGDLRFRCFTGGRAQMTDRDGTTDGTWTTANGQVTLHFGKVTYAGRVQNGTLSGTADNGRSRWTFTVSSRQ